MNSDLIKVERIYKNSIPLNYEKFYKNKAYNDVRRLKLILLSDILGKQEFFKKLSYDDKTQFIMIVENSCLNESIRKSNEHDVHCVWSNNQFANIYHNICYQIFTNLDYDSGIFSKSLIKKIENNKINLHKIAKMNCKELCPEKYKEIEEKISKRNNIKKNLKYSELYHCRKCKKNQCTVEKRFNRSLDEGVNLTINCLFCGYSWCA